MKKKYKRFTRIVVATEDEKKIIKRRYPNIEIIVTGVGPLNVYQALRKVPRWYRIINFGYVGSNTLEIGKDYVVTSVTQYHPNVDYLEPLYILDFDPKKDKDMAVCLSSNDFVLETNITEPTLFDMELAYICAMGFKHVRAIKRVSDNLNLDQYYETTTY